MAVSANIIAFETKRYGEANAVAETHNAGIENKIPKSRGNVKMNGNLMIKDNTLIGYRGNDAVVEVPEGVVKIGTNAFSAFNHVEKINIPDTVEEICDEAFAQMYSLKELFVPKSVVKIGKNICGRCYALTSIIVADDNPVYASFNCNCIIEKSTGTLIQGCSETIIPNVVRVLAPRCFWKHHRLNNIDIPNSVVSIGKEAFFETHLSLISISKNVESISPSAFLGNFGLKTIKIDKENPSYSDCDSNSIVQKSGNVLLMTGTDGVVPGTIKEIGLRTDENTLTPPQCYPFYNATEVESISIPNTVRYINWHAFENCRALKAIYYEGTKEEFSSLFTSVPSLEIELLKSK